MPFLFLGQVTMNTKPVCSHHPYATPKLVMPWRWVCPKCDTFLGMAEPPGMLHRPMCASCSGIKTVRLYRMIAINGAEHIAWWCTSCQRYVKDEMGRLFLPGKAVTEFINYWHAVSEQPNLPKSIAELPLLKEHAGGEPCAICGNTATEYNHFMPQAFKDAPDIAPEWAEWDKLGAWLCEYHHRLWHANVAPLWALAQAKREMVR